MTDSQAQPQSLLDQAVSNYNQPTPSGQPQPTQLSAQPAAQPAAGGNLLDQALAEHNQTQTAAQPASQDTEPHGATYNYLHGLYQNTVKPVVDLAANLPANMLSYYDQKADEAGGTGTIAGNVNAMAHVAGPGTALDLLAQLRAHPTDPVQVLKDAAKDPQHPIAKIVSGIIQSHIQTAQKAWENQKAAYTATRQAVDAARRGDYEAANAAAQQADLYQTNTFGYAGATALPVLGPAAANAGEDIGEGRVAEGLGKGTGLIASVLAPHAPEAVKGAVKVLPDAVTHVYDATLGRVIPREQLPLTMKEPSVFNPEAGTKTPISEVSPTANRAVAGSHVQDIAERVKDRAGAEAGVAASAAKAVPIAPEASDGFVSNVRQVSSEAKGLSIDPADEFAKIQKMSDDLAQNPPQTHAEFDQAKAKISAKLDEQTLTLQQKRLYSGLRSTIQDEYYGRIDDVNPTLRANLESANKEYNQQINRLENGPAKTLFNKNAPEDVIKNLASANVKESAATDVMKSMLDADTFNVTNDSTAEVAPKGYVRAVRNSVLKQQMEEFATRRNADGNPVQVDAQKWLNRFEKNAAANREIFGYGDEYDAIQADLKAMAKRQYNVARNRTVLKHVAAYAGTGIAGTWILHSLLGSSTPTQSQPAE
jgi:hypothetical protein